MNVKNLYRTFLIGAGVLIFLIISLRLIAGGTFSRAKSGETPPSSSALTEVEFESGRLVIALKTAQEKRLTSYRGNPDKDAFVEVPVERAIQEYLAIKKEKP